MSYNFESGLSEALEQLFKIETDYNVIIHIGKEPNFKEFHAHSNILRCRSEYFNKILSSECIEGGKYIIKEPNISPQEFDIILRYIYTDKVDMVNITGTKILKFMIISDGLMLNKLTKFTEYFIVENYQQFLRNDPVGILQSLYYCKAFVDLQEFCLNKICFKPEILFNSDKFNQLPAPLLEIILKRDDLNLNEIEIWEYLIKWGLAQEKILNQDVSKWNKDDFNIFRRILYKFVPLIRFYEISSEDYFNKVKPYEKVLSKELRNDIIKFYMIPGFKPTYTPRYSDCLKCNIDSIIINQNHIVLFINWIDRNKEKYVNNIPYEFKLLYRASRDGNTAAAFHDKCDNKGATIVIVKIKNSEQIVGGYNPLSWDSSGIDKSTKDSFIFSIADKNNLQSANVSYSKGNICSIRNFSYCGPLFGCNDLIINYNISSNIWYHSSQRFSSYFTINLPKSMNVDDYEVFQVIKK